MIPSRVLIFLWKLTGPTYKLLIGGEDRVAVSSPELVNEVCCRKEFVKYPLGFLKQLREIAPEGLFRTSF